MKRKVIPFFLILVFMLLLSLDAFALTQSTSINQVLSFNGTKANCKVIVTDAGRQIEVTAELWNEDTLIASWEASGSSSVVLSKTCDVVSGETYTLKAYGTINGNDFEMTPLTRTCP